MANHFKNNATYLKKTVLGEAILNYIENLKEEISLSLGSLNKKINHIQSVINEMRGESE